MIEVPDEFLPSIGVVYPHENWIVFEEWVAKQLPIISEIEYLPIQWTAYFVNNGYGNDVLALHKLQQFIDRLPKDKKYWTIVQYDDGILVDVSGIDLLQFNMSKNIGVPIPLLCMEHSYVHTQDKSILASFIGSHTHPIREHIFKISNAEYYISDEQHDINRYCKILANSIFGLCPRGYGLASFRATECMQYGTIPVYISDEFIIPFGVDFEGYGVLIKEEDAHRIEEILSNFTMLQIIEKQNNIKKYYEEYYTYTGAFNKIKEYLES